MKTPFRTRASRHNVLSWLDKKHLEIGTARNNLADLLRREVSVQEISMDALKVMVHENNKLQHLLPTVNLFYNLRDAEHALLDAARFYENDLRIL